MQYHLSWFLNSENSMRINPQKICVEILSVASPKLLLDRRFATTTQALVGLWAGAPHIPTLLWLMLRLAKGLRDQKTGYIPVELFSMPLKKSAA